MKKIFTFLAAAMLLTMLFATTALASTNLKIPTKTTPGTSYTHQSDYVETDTGWTYRTYQYTFTLTTDSLVKVTTKNTGSTVATLDLYRVETDGSETYLYDYAYMEAGTENTTTFVLKKGNYLLSDDSYNDGVAFTFSYQVTPSENKANYCKSKATALSRNRSVTIVENGATHYVRWYKIKLTKKQAIHVKTTYGDYNCFTFYNSRGKRIASTGLGDATGSTGMVYTSKQQKKGTYYIRAKVAYRSNKNASASTFYWY